MSLHADSLACATPTSGLILIEVSVQSAQAAEARLEVIVDDRVGDAFWKPLALAKGSTSGWVAVHGHHLANGAHAVVVRLRTGDGAMLGEQSLQILVRNLGAIAAGVRQSLKGAGVPLIVDECDSDDYDYAGASLDAWFDREPAAIEAHLQTLLDAGKATPIEVEALRHFAECGYLVVADAIEPDLLQRVNEAVDDAVGRKVEGYEWGSSQRMHDLHRSYDAIHQLWLHPRIMRMLELIFEVPGRPSQSLTYVFGSQQQRHQDLIHLTPFPAGRMCGVWTALEDVQPDSGELVVFPGSHRLQRVYMKTVGIPKVIDDWALFSEKVAGLWIELSTRAGLKREIYQPKAGTVLIWHENLMHAGSLRKDLTKSRRSIVGHYFAEGSVVYCDSSGRAGMVFEGDLSPSTNDKVAAS